MGGIFIRQNLEAGIFSFRNNLLRSTLTITGIVVGIAAVVAVLSIGKGNQTKIEAEVDKMGASLFWAEPRSSFSMSQVGASMSVSFSNPAYKLTLEDARLIKGLCTLVKYVAPATSFFVQGTLDGKIIHLNVTGTTPEYHEVKLLRLVEGRYLCDLDLILLNKVCVVEENPGMNLASKDRHQLTINGVTFRIVGVIKRENPFLTTFNSIAVHVPLTVAQEEFSQGKSIEHIYCLADKSTGSPGVELAKHQVEEILSTSLRITNHGIPVERLPFQVVSSKDVFERAESMVKTATMVTAGIGMLSLFVGGIGIMNILLASVTERTREIGLRKAVGARKRDVMVQCLFESIALSLAGGVLGVVIGIFVGKLLGAYINVPAVLSADSAFIGIFLSLITGIIFGVYPAWKAARMNPVDALRYE